MSNLGQFRDKRPLGGPPSGLRDGQRLDGSLAPQKQPVPPILHGPTRLVRLRAPHRDAGPGHVIRVATAEAEQLITDGTGFGVVAVRLLENYGNVNRTEIAGYSDDEAAEMIADRIAELYHDPAASEAAKAMDAPPVDRAMHREDATRKESPH